MKKQERGEILDRSLAKLQTRLTERKLPLIGSDDDKIRKRYKNQERETHLINMYYKQESYTLFFKESYPQERETFNNTRQQPS